MRNGDALILQIQFQDRHQYRWCSPTFLDMILQFLHELIHPLTPSLKSACTCLKGFSLLLVLIMAIPSAFAGIVHEQTITGRITDLEGRGISEVVVTVKGTGRHAVTDSLGIYSIASPTGRRTIVVSAIGYHQETMTVNVAAEHPTKADFSLRLFQKELREVEITAGNIGRLRHSAYNTVAIDTRALQNTTKSLGDALTTAPGVKVRETGGVGSDMNVSLDGFSGKHVKVFIDGVPQEGVGSSFGLNNIPVSYARRIEVYKGVVPVAFGADAIGGVINVVTAHPQKGWHLDGSYAGGSFNTHKSTINGNWVWASGWKLEMSAFQNYSDNSYYVYTPVKDLSNGSIDYRHPERVRRFNDAYHNEVLSIKSGVINRPWADQLLIGLTWGGMKKHIQTGVRQEVVYGRKYRFGHSLIPSLQYVKNNLWHNRLDLSFTANYNRNTTTNVDTSAYAFNWRGESILRNSPGEQNYLHLRYEDDNWDTGLNLRFRPESHGTFTLHHTFAAFDRSSTSLLTKEKSKAPIDRTTTKNITGFSYLYMPNDVWNATLFAKYYALHVSGPVSTSNLKDNFVRKRHTLGFFGFGTAATYRFLKQAQVKLSYERACRLPDVDELFGDDDLESGSVTLSPEQSHNVNLNLSYTFRRGLHNLLIEIGGIYRNTRDYIQRNVIEVGGGRFGASYVNFGRVLTHGLNASVRYDLGRRLSVGGNFTYMDVRDNMPFAQNGVTRNYGYRDRMPNLPYLFGDADMTVRWPLSKGRQEVISLTYDTQYLHSFTFYSSGFGANKGEYVVSAQLAHNAAITLSLAHGHYALTFETRNFTDERLYDNFSLQKAGRAFYAKIRFNLGH